MKQQEIKLLTINYVRDLELKDLGIVLPCYGSIEKPYFFWKDVRNLGTTKEEAPSQFLRGIELEENEEILTVILGYAKNAQGKKEQGGLRQGTEIRVFTEDGLYEVLMAKNGLKQFRKPIKKILKEIRSNGGYISEDATEEQVEKLIENYSMRTITKEIHECDVMELENVVNEILEANTTSGKRNRVDSRLKHMDATEYKQHVRKHIRKAIESKPYSKDIKAHGVEMAIRDRLVIALTDDVLATTNRKYGQLI